MHWYRFRVSKRRWKHQPSPRRYLAHHLLQLDHVRGEVLSMSTNRPVVQCANALVRGNNVSRDILHIDHRTDASLVEQIERDESGMGQRVGRLRNGHRRAVDIGRILSHLCHP